MTQSELWRSVSLIIVARIKKFKSGAFQSRNLIGLAANWSAIFAHLNTSRNEASIQLLNI